MRVSGSVGAFVATMADYQRSPQSIEKDRAVEIARQALRNPDMMLTAAEAAVVSRQLLRALGLAEIV